MYSKLFSSTFTRRYVLAVFVALTMGCANTMKQEECTKADWYTLGFEDGRKGAPLSTYSEYQKQCQRYAVTPDLEAYTTGRQEGLAIYCTPENGLRVGQEGETYHGVCPRELESAFKKRYEFGRRFYQLNTQISARLSEARNTDSELYALRQEAQKSKAQLMRSDLSDAQRHDLSNRLERYASRAGQLEERLRYLNAEVIRLQMHLQQLN